MRYTLWIVVLMWRLVGCAIHPFVVRHYVAQNWATWSTGQPFPGHNDRRRTCRKQYDLQTSLSHTNTRAHTLINGPRFNYWIVHDFLSRVSHDDGDSGSGLAGQAAVNPIKRWCQSCQLWILITLSTERVVSPLAGQPSSTGVCCASE